MSDRILVIETITDGAMGYPYDEILSIGICSVDADAGEFESVYDAVVAVEPKYVGKTKLDYAESKGLDVPSLYSGVPLEDIVKEFKKIVKGNYVTSYDIRQEFGRYLTRDPWDVTLETHVMPSIMSRQPISLKCKYPEDEADTIRKAYRRMFRNDPANVGRGKGALELSQMASQILIDLRSRGKYRSDLHAEHTE